MQDVTSDLPLPGIESVNNINVSQCSRHLQPEFTFSSGLDLLRPIWLVESSDCSPATQTPKKKPKHEIFVGENVWGSSRRWHCRIHRCLFHNNFLLFAVMLKMSRIIIRACGVHWSFCYSQVVQHGWVASTYLLGFVPRTQKLFRFAWRHIWTAPN